MKTPLPILPSLLAVALAPAPAAQLGDVAIDAEFLGTGPDHQLGRSLAVLDAFALAGSPQSDAHGSASGEVRVYEHDVFESFWSSAFSLTAFDAPDGSQFGHGLALDGERLVVGAPYEDHPEHENSGRVYVYRRVGAAWELETTLEPLQFQTSQSISAFGQSVAISGDTIVAGALGSPLPIPGVVPDAAYVFRFDGASWSQEAVLRAPSPTDVDFGVAVDISGDTVVVGAPKWDNGSGFGNLDWGAAYVFERGANDQWTQSAVLHLAAGSATHRFAESVAIDGDLIAIGAWGHSANAGAVFPAQRVGGVWTLGAALAVPEPHFSHQIGHAVGVSAGRIVASARFDGGAASSAAGYVFDGATAHALQPPPGATGSVFYQSADLNGDQAILGSWQTGLAFDGRAHAYAWDGSSWGLVSDLEKEPIAPFGSFGWKVAVAGDTAAVGARLADDQGESAGRVELYENSGRGHELVEQFLPESVMAGDGYGTAVAMSQSWAFVGSPGDDEAGADSGSVYTFSSLLGLFLESSPAKLVGSTTQPGDGFGGSLAASGDRLLVGSQSGGAVHAFEHDGAEWVETDVFGGGASGAGYGSALALEGDAALVGVPGAAGGGAVEVWTTDGVAWALEETLALPGGVDGDAFGASVSLSGDRAAIGAPGRDSAGADAGAVHLFERIDGKWTATHVVLAGDTAAGHELGSAVHLAGSRLVAGAPGADPQGSRGGAAYAFYECGGSWIQRERFVHPEPSGGDEIGAAVATGTHGTFVSAPDHDNPTPTAGGPYDAAGSVLVFPQRPSDQPRLYFDYDSLLLGDGPDAEFHVCASEEYGGDYYLVLGSISGAFPGVDLFGLHVDLNFDAYTMLSVTNEPPFQGSVGLLDPTGAAQGSYDLPPLTNPAIGVQVRHTALVVDATTIVGEFVTPVTFDLLEPGER